MLKYMLVILLFAMFASISCAVTVTNITVNKSFILGSSNGSYYGHAGLGRSMVKDSSGNLYVAHMYYNATDGSFGPYGDGYIAKSTDNGNTWNPTWVKLNFNASCVRVYYNGGAIAIDSSDNLHVAYICTNVDGGVANFSYVKVTSAGAISIFKTMETSNVITCNTLGASSGAPSISIAVSSNDTIMYVNSAGWDNHAVKCTSHASFSTNGGVNWTGWNQIWDQHGGCVGQAEPASVVANGTNFVAFVAVTADLSREYALRWNGTNNSIGNASCPVNSSNGWVGWVYDGHYCGEWNDVGVCGLGIQYNYCGHSSSCTTSDGLVHQVMYNMQNNDIRYANSTNWTATKILVSAAGSGVSDPQLACSGTNVAMFYRNSSNSLEIIKLSSTDSGANWGSNSSISTLSQAIYLGGWAVLQNDTSFLYGPPHATNNSLRYGWGIFNVTYSNFTQLTNATTNDTVLFSADTTVVGVGFCNYTTLPNDRNMVNTSLYITNSSSANISITNATNWTSWNCEEAQSPYTVYIKMPAITYNCTDNSTGWSQDLGEYSTTTMQYITRNCTMANPSSLNYTNLTSSAGCLENWTCNFSSYNLTSLNNGTADTNAQDANGSIIADTKALTVYQNTNQSGINESSVEYDGTMNWTVQNNGTFDLINVAANWTDGVASFYSCSCPTMNLTSGETKVCIVNFSVPILVSPVTVGSLGSFPYPNNRKIVINHTYNRTLTFTLNISDPTTSTNVELFRCTNNLIADCDYTNGAVWVSEPYNRTGGRIIVENQTMSDKLYVLSYSNPPSGGGGGGGGGTTPTPTPSPSPTISPTPTPTPIPCPKGQHRDASDMCIPDVCGLINGSMKPCPPGYKCINDICERTIPCGPGEPDCEKDCAPTPIFEVFKSVGDVILDALSGLRALNETLSQIIKSILRASIFGIPFGSLLIIICIISAVYYNKIQQSNMRDMLIIIAILLMLFIPEYAVYPFEKLVFSGGKSTAC